MSTIPGRNWRILTYMLAFCLMVTSLVYLFFGNTAVAQWWRLHRAEGHRSLILNRLGGDPRYRDIKIGILPCPGGCTLYVCGILSSEADLEPLKGIINKTLPSLRMHYRVVIKPHDKPAINEQEENARDLRGGNEKVKRGDQEAISSMEGKSNGLLHPHLGPEAVKIEEGHVHTTICGHYLDGDQWYFWKGHVHGPGCGHRYKNGIWVVRKE